MPINAIKPGNPSATIGYVEAAQLIQKEKALAKTARTAHFHEASKLINGIYSGDISDFSRSDIMRIAKYDNVNYEIDRFGPDFGYTRTIVAQDTGLGGKKFFKGLIQYIGFEDIGDVSVMKSDFRSRGIYSDRNIITNTVKNKAIAINNYIFCGDKDNLEFVFKYFKKWMEAHFDVLKLKTAKIR